MAGVAGPPTAVVCGARDLVFGGFVAFVGRAGRVAGADPTISGADAEARGGSRGGSTRGGPGGGLLEMLLPAPESTGACAVVCRETASKPSASPIVASSSEIAIAILAPIENRARPLEL